MLLLDGFSFICKANDSNVLQTLKLSTRQFCQRSTVHGLKYIFNTKPIDPLEDALTRSIWLTSCVLGATVVVILMNLVRIRYQTTPTITTVETNNFPIWNTQFPAVTLCNINKVYEPATLNIRGKLMEKGLSEEEVQTFLSRLASLIAPVPIDESFLRTYVYLETLNYTTQKLMLELMQPCEKLVLHCMWLGKEYPCKSIFRVTMGADGFCCSFNNKAIKADLELNNERKTVSDQLNTPVYRVAGYGEFVGLSLLLDTESEAYISPRNSFYGVNVMIHDAEDFPDTSVSHVVVQPGEDVSVAIIPRVIMSNPEVRTLPPAQRNCLFYDEQPLRASDRYSYQSCMVECVVDTMLRLCGCIPFFYPQLQIPVYSRFSRQCSLHDVNCLYKLANVFSSLSPPSAINVFNETTIEGMDCDCLPGCSEQYLQIQTITAVREPHNILTIPENTIPFRLRENTTDFEKLSTLHVYFKEISCIKYRRDLFMAWDAVIASLGGIVGLCLGGSVISLIELLYFFTVRLVYRLMCRENRPTSSAKRGRILRQHRVTSDNGVGKDMTQYGYLE